MVVGVGLVGLVLVYELSKWGFKVIFLEKLLNLGGKVVGWFI